MASTHGRRPPARRPPARVRGRRARRAARACARNRFRVQRLDHRLASPLNDPLPSGADERHEVYVPADARLRIDRTGPEGDHRGLHPARESCWSRSRPRSGGSPAPRHGAHARRGACGLHVLVVSGTLGAYTRRKDASRMLLNETGRERRSARWRCRAWGLAPPTSWSSTTASCSGSRGGPSTTAQPRPVRRHPGPDHGARLQRALEVRSTIAHMRTVPVTTAEECGPPAGSRGIDG